MRFLGGLVGRSVTVTSSTSPTFNTFHNAVINNQSSIFSAGVIRHDGSRSGHSVSVNGIVRANHRIAGNMNFIRVADGWGTTFRYIQAWDERFVDIRSDVFTIR